MKTVISVVSVLACAFSLDAQITTTVKRLPDGLEELSVKNSSANALVAFVIVAKWELTWNEWYFDAEIGTSEALPPNQEKVLVRLGSSLARQVGFSQPILRAGIFADGSTTGDADLLRRLILRRSNMLLAVETAMDILIDAGRHNVSRDQLIAQFRRMADSLNRWYVPPEQKIGHDLYQSIMGKLIGLPEVEFGSPFPPTVFVEQETAALNRQRYALSASQPSLAEVAGRGR